jgi:hypothetical protein
VSSFGTLTVKSEGRDSEVRGLGLALLVLGFDRV